jgi:hypothetical protein
MSASSRYRTSRHRFSHALVFAAVNVVFVTAARAQSASEPTGRLQIAVGAGWVGGTALGDQPADLRAAGSGGAFRLFDTETDLGGAGSFEARLGVVLTRRYAIEARAAISRPALETTVSSDAETAGSFTLEENLDRYVFDGGLVIHLDELNVMGVRPFALAGIGYMRQLHEGRQLIEEGPIYYVGGGLSRVLVARAQGFIRALSLRADLRLNLISLESGDGTRPQGSASGTIVLTF